MIKAGFILLTITMATLVVLMLYRAATTAWGQERGKVFAVKMVLSLLLWFSYVVIVSATGILDSRSLPPRVPLLLVLPLFLFMGYFFASARYKPVVAAVPAPWLVYLQGFRIIVELLLWALSLHALLPVSTTFEGYNYEIVIAVSALVVGYLGFSKKIIPRRIILLWNIIGLVSLAIIVFIFMTHIYKPSLWHDNENFSLHLFTSFPYTLLAGFLMPLAVFLHVFSIIKTRRNSTAVS